MVQVFLTHFLPMYPIYTPWKHQKTKGFLVFWGDIKWEHWPEMGTTGKAYAGLLLWNVKL